MTDKVSVTQADQNLAHELFHFKGTLSAASRIVARHRVAAGQSTPLSNKVVDTKVVHRLIREATRVRDLFERAVNIPRYGKDEASREEMVAQIMQLDSALTKADAALRASQPTPAEGLASIIRTAVKLRHRDASDDYNTGFNNGLKAAETAILAALSSTAPAPSEVEAEIAAARQMAAAVEDFDPVTYLGERLKAARASSDHNAAEDLGLCIGCNEPLRVGQVVTVWEDEVGHYDCKAPYSLARQPELDADEHTPPPMVLIGSPARYAELDAITAALEPKEPSQ